MTTPTRRIDWDGDYKNSPVRTLMESFMKPLTRKPPRRVKGDHMSRPTERSEANMHVYTRKKFADINKQHDEWKDATTDHTFLRTS